MTPDRPVFATTRWTLVVRARGATSEARAALAELCEAYWMPVFRFLRRDGRSEDEARELAQEFFARLLAGSGLETADPARGRFRSYLLGAVKHFLADARDRAGRQKRGGGVAHESLEGGGPVVDGEATGREIADLSEGFSDEAFDREWALAVMDRALAGVDREFAAAGKAAEFRVLKGWLAGAGDGVGAAQADAARELGLSEGAVKVAVHRLRKRFREAVREELGQTLPEGADPEEELRYLVSVLRRAGTTVSQ